MVHGLVYAPKTRCYIDIDIIDYRQPREIGREFRTQAHSQCSVAAQDWALARSAAKMTSTELIWLDDEPKPRPKTVRAAE